MSQLELSKDLLHRHYYYLPLLVIFSLGGRLLGFVLPFLCIWTSTHLNSLLLLLIEIEIRFLGLSNILLKSFQLLNNFLFVLVGLEIYLGVTLIITVVLKQF